MEETLQGLDLRLDELVAAARRSADVTDHPNTEPNNGGTGRAAESPTSEHQEPEMTSQVEEMPTEERVEPEATETVPELPATATDQPISNTNGVNDEDRPGVPQQVSNGDANQPQDQLVDTTDQPPTNTTPSQEAQVQPCPPPETTASVEPNVLADREAGHEEDQDEEDESSPEDNPNPVRQLPKLQCRARQDANDANQRRIHEIQMLKNDLAVRDLMITDLRSEVERLKTLNDIQATKIQTLSAALRLAGAAPEDQPPPTELRTGDSSG